MKLNSPRDVRALLASRGIRPSKALGQNFLVDGNLLAWIADHAEVGPDDTVLEIGPGLGGLTEALAARARRVVAIEKDARLFDLLSERAAAWPNVEPILADGLEADFNALLGERRWKVVSNLPYSVGTRILVRLLEAEPPAERITVTLQSDVAERLTAEPGGAAYGLLAIWTRRLYQAKILRLLPPSVFYPPPAIVSAVVDLRRRPAPLCAPRNLPHFRELTRRAFMARRKQIRRILLDSPPELKTGADGDVEAALRKIGVAPEARSETLTIEAWGALSDALAAPTTGEER